MQSRILVASKDGKTHNNNASTKSVNNNTTNAGQALNSSKLSSSSSSSSSSSHQKSHSKQPIPSSPTKAVTSTNAYSNNHNNNGSAFHRDADKENIRSPVMVSAIPARLTQSATTATTTSEPTMAQLLAQSPAHTHIRQATEPAANGGNNAGGNIGLASWRKGQGFKAWESELLKSQDVRRKADVAQLYFLDYYFDLISYVGARRRRLELFKQDMEKRKITGAAYASEWSGYTGRERVLLRKRRTKLRLDAFHIITQVGQGGYGEVFLARKKDTSEVVALKKMRKRTLAKMDEIKHVLVERDILTATKTPWLVALLYAFQDPIYVYLAMEYVPGGDFRTLLNNSGVLKEEHARFYIAEMCCSVDALHKLGYIHRDLKPENFLVDKTGHVKLTDFGLAAGNLSAGRIEQMKHKLDEVKDTDVIYRSTKDMKDIYRSIRKAEPRTADSIVGSPDYMSIECMRGHSYSYSVDYWSLGCILFEFLAGYPPFSGATPEETWANLKNWQKTLRRPHYDRPEDRIFNLSDAGWSAICQLIADKSRRPSTLDEVKIHPFYDGVSWKNLRDTPAPFVPALDSELDVGYFDNFEDPAELSKYKEVFDKQKNVEAIKELDEPFGRGVWVGFTYRPRNKLVDTNELIGLSMSSAIADDDDGVQVMF